MMSSLDQGCAQTILIVDDMPESLSVLGELLQPHYRVRVATSGARALREAASTPRPDLILLDVMMPDMDGYTVLDRLRADPATCAIPVIFITALDAAEDEAYGLARGAADYITKPVRPAIVLARVRGQLELKQARDWLKAGGAIPEDPGLRDELTAPEIVPRLDGKLQIESKRDLKGRGIPSGNRADALILSFAFPVSRRRPRIPGQAQGQQLTDYDPLARPR
jgi:CheY-like chemotaxis protein